jgi:predicted RNase H-like HicB family nuclease
MSYIVLTCKYHKEDNKWVAICEELGTSIFGKTLNEAQERLEDAIELHLDTLEKVGELKRFFEENKIKVHAGLPRKVSIDFAPDSTDFVRPCIHNIGELIPA